MCGCVTQSGLGPGMLGLGVLVLGVRVNLLWASKLCTCVSNFIVVNIQFLHELVMGEKMYSLFSSALKSNICFTGL